MASARGRPRSRAIWASLAFRLLLAAPVLLGALLLGACAGSSLPEPTAKYVEHGDRNGYPTTLPSLKHGRRLYLNRCSGCHGLYRPEKFSPQDWPSLVEDMASDAKINADQVRDITRYLVSASSALQDTSAPRPMGKPRKSNRP